MSLDFVMLIVSAAAAVTAAVYYFGRKVLKGTEALLLDLVPVIHALGKVRSAWRQTRQPEAVTGREEDPRALP
ncbi:hypothetical protein C6W96_34665 [Streptomyces sp. CS149]|jgi:hypothetical protein|uniref:Uncharacterized protein n=2 Tax=Streptomyces TaxID=1883 RepID=A0AB37X2Y8_9ACTN|nr:MULTISPECIES: hypothetical protein [Streptomyces]MYX83405.1 hypothetical protein [Streptomyces sp. SID4915]QLA55074.1 hypothetical protein HWN34_00040 [Streptomyces violascens]TPN00856.1 hypothetical protein FKO01_50465 [Mesorhizobium sp. B2-3-3]AWL30648.1 hypothetical protein B9S66_00020 [Streptomyces sp. SM17]MBK3386227.1 hypothetical protein [Streptomyces sp. DEF147AK]